MDKIEDVAREAIEGLKESSKEEKDKRFEKILSTLNIPKKLYLEKIKNVG